MARICVIRKVKGLVMLPISLRSDAQEQAYCDLKWTNSLPSMEESESLKEWEHWRLVDNLFGYDMAFSVHHMLLPKRVFRDKHEATEEELKELDDIITTFVNEEYEVIFENVPRKRNYPHYHIHVASYHDTREQMHQNLAGIVTRLELDPYGEY